MLETLYVCAAIALTGLFLWGPIHRRYLETRPRAALVARYLIIVSGAYCVWSIASAVAWDLIRENFLPDAPPYMWGSLPSKAVYIVMAVMVGALSLPPKRARAIEAAMTEPSPERPSEIYAPEEAHWTDGLSATEKFFRIVGELGKGMLQLGWLALVCIIGLVALVAAYIALQGLNDVSTPQAVLIGAAIIAWAIYNSNRK